MIYEFSSPEDRDILVQAFQKGQNDGLVNTLEKMKSVKEGDGNLLDNSMIVYGSGLSDPNRHDHLDLPILLAGKGGGTLTPGRHVVSSKGTPLNNLYLSMLDRMGSHIDHLGDSTGPLPGLF